MHGCVDGILFNTGNYIHDKWVPVTMAWYVIKLQMEDRPPVWRVAANILNKQSWIANMGWSYSLGIG